jgi:hypothetical protein
MISIMPVSQNSSLNKFLCTITLITFVQIGREMYEKEQNLIYYLKQELPSL